MGKKMGKKVIMSYWDYEKASWDGERYINRRWSDIREKLLEVVFEDSGHTDERKILLKFIGGPTGYESYYLNSLLEHDLNNNNQFCICGGTVNSWARCFIKCRDLDNIIKIYQKENI